MHPVNPGSMVRVPCWDAARKESGGVAAKRYQAVIFQLFALCGPECVTEPLQLQRSVGEMEIHKENGNEDLRYWSFGAAKCLEASIAENNDVKVVESMARRRYGK